MQRDARVTVTVLTIFTVLCAGCAESSSESQNLAGNSRPGVAISATPRTLTWKKPISSTSVAKKKPAPAATSSGSNTHGEKESAEKLLSIAVAPLVTADNDHVAVAVADLSTGQSASYSGTQEFITASIAKADILATRLYQEQQQGGHLSQHEMALATTMIENSDNDAATALYDDDGEAPGIDAANQAFGLRETTVGASPYWGLTTTTVDDQIRLLRQIFTSSSVLSPAARSYIQGLMSQVEPGQQWGVPAAAGNGTAFAVKNGWLPDPNTGLWEINSIGEVTHGGQRMLIAVLSTDNSGYSSGISVIEGIVTKAADALADATGT